MKRLLCTFSLFLAVGCGSDDADTPDEVTQGPQTLKDFAEGEYAGSSVILHRYMSGDNDRLEAEVSATGLTEGNVYTFWWIIFNDDESCVATPNNDGNPRCGLDDFTPAQEEATVQTFAYGIPAPTGGSVAPASGTVTFDRTYLVTDTVGGAGLTDIEGAEVHVLLRDHGPELATDDPNHDAQFTNYVGGCLPDNGPNECAEIAFSIFIDSKIDPGDCTGHVCP